MFRNRSLIRALIFLISVFLNSLPVFAQLVQVGPNDPNYCVKVERIKRNLHVATSGEVKGQIRDRSGEVFKNSRVELRNFVSPEKQNMVATTTTDRAIRVQLCSKRGISAAGVSDQSLPTARGDALRYGCAVRPGYCP